MKSYKLTMQNTEILKLNGVKKTYGEKTILNLNEICIHPGEIYGLIGPNGAGKSSLMKIISSLTKADTGEIKLFGQSLNEKNKTELLKKIGVFIEGPAFYGNLTGAENMKIIKHLKNLTDRDISDAIEYVGLQNQINKKVSKYSLGMKQRLGLAMTLSGLPPLLVLDEPTNGLDPQGIKEIRNLILHLSKEKGVTIMISSHILGEMEKMVDYIGVINKGELLYQGSIANFKSKFGSEIAFKTSNNEETLRLLNAYHPRLSKDCVSIKQVNDYEVSRMIKALHSRTIDVYRVYDTSKSLEDLFIDLTGRGSL